MNDSTCKTCRHFRQHYIRYGRSYREAYCGHCVYPRVKQRSPDTKGCIYHENRLYINADTEKQAQTEP